MPVIEIKTQELPQSEDVEAVLVRLNGVVAEALDTPVDHVWSYWLDIPHGRQARGTKAVAADDERACHPLVNVIAYRGKPQEAIAAALCAIDTVLCDVQGIPRGSSFITWTEVQPGQVFTGGSVRSE